MAVWNPKIECAKRSEIEAIQLERLKWSVQHAYDHVPMLSLIHISEPTRQAEISYAVFCLKKKTNTRDRQKYRPSNV